MTYTIITPKTVQKQLEALRNEVCDRVAVKIQQLAENPRPDGVVKLKGFIHRSLDALAFGLFT